MACTALATVAMGLAAAGVQAQTEGRNQGRNDNQRKEQQQAQGEAKTIRGWIANVTVEGETAIDFNSNRAATVEMSYLTIIGSEGQGRMRGRGQGAREGDSNERERGNRDQAAGQGAQNERNNRDRQASGERQRHNLYIVWLTPRTEIRNAASYRDRGRNDQERGNQERGNANTKADANRGGVEALAGFTDLEVGDRVEVRFLQTRSGEENATTSSRRHGRHRIYFGNAQSITILSEPSQNDRDRDRDSNRDDDANRDRDRDRPRDNARNPQDR
jgi:hypothetical protein